MPKLLLNYLIDFSNNSQEKCYDRQHSTKEKPITELTNSDLKTLLKLPDIFRERKNIN